VVTHAGVVNSHKDSIEYNTECYEEVNECIHDEELYDVSEALPARTALPVKHDLMQTYTKYLLDTQLTGHSPAHQTYTFRHHSRYTYVGYTVR